MYEIDGVPISEEALRNRAKELNITFEELIKRNSKILVKIGDAPLVAETVPIDTANPAEGEQIFVVPENESDNTQNLTPAQDNIKAKENLIKSYDKQIADYDKEIQKILNLTQATGEQKLEMVNALPVPSNSGGYNAVSSKDDELEMPNNLDGSTPDLVNEYSENKEKQLELKNKLLESENKQEVFDEAFGQTLMNDPLVESRRNFYIENLKEKVDLFKQELIDKNVYDLTTKQGVNAAQERVNKYYAGLIDESMRNDEVVIKQGEKIASSFGIIESEINTSEQRKKKHCVLNVRQVTRIFW